jgi:hypothetical protein
MTETSRRWEPIPDGDFTVPAKPARGLWTPVLNYVTGPVILRVTATGTWQPIDWLRDCGPDGFPHWAFGRDFLLWKKAPLGALIAKIGGSVAGVDDSSDIFLVGAQAVLTLEKSTGPLYLTINDAPSAFDDNLGEVGVVIERAQEP